MHIEFSVPVLCEYQGSPASAPCSAVFTPHTFLRAGVNAGGFPTPTLLPKEAPFPAPLGLHWVKNFRKWGLSRRGMFHHWVEALESWWAAPKLFWVGTAETTWCEGSWKPGTALGCVWVSRNHRASLGFSVVTAAFFVPDPADEGACDAPGSAKNCLSKMLLWSKKDVCKENCIYRLKSKGVCVWNMYVLYIIVRYTYRVCKYYIPYLVCCIVCTL